MSDPRQEMEHLTRSFAIVGSSCRLPGGVKSAAELWDMLMTGDWSSCSTSPPESRGLNTAHTASGLSAIRGGWLGTEGIEDFDAAFFGISSTEAQTMRPNTRLALELTWEAFENAGIPPSAVRGRNVSISLAMGTEDGWDIKRYAEDGALAFDHNWASNSDPSGAVGRVSHFFDFRGASAVVSGACAGGATALESGVSSLLLQEAEIAVVGAVTTHFCIAPFAWASALSVASSKGRCSAFSEEADGYVPSEGAVFLLLKRLDLAIAHGDVIDGVVRAIAVGHNGRTHTFTSPSVEAQQMLIRRSLSSCQMTSDDIWMLEAHGTGTKLGDLIEMEALEGVFQGQRIHPLLVSSSKTVVGHCQAAAALVGILKTVLCFQNLRVPPHHVIPFKKYLEGPIRIPTVVTSVDRSSPFRAAVSSFGFTGSIASIIMEEAPHRTIILVPTLGHYILPFSARTLDDLRRYVCAVREWVIQTQCSIEVLALILSIAREHHEVRKAYLAQDINEFLHVSAGDVSEPARQVSKLDEQDVMLQFVEVFRDADNIAPILKVQQESDVECKLPSRILQTMQKAAVFYESGGLLPFSQVYRKQMLPSLFLRSFPRYQFNRQRNWRSAHLATQQSLHSSPDLHERPMDQRHGAQMSRDPHVPSLTTSDVVTDASVIDIVCGVLQRDPGGIAPSQSIFDIGIDSLNSIELAHMLSAVFSRRIAQADLYRLSTVEAIAQYLQGDDGLQEDLQQIVDSLLQEFSLPLIGRSGEQRTLSLPHVPAILLTGATGFLGSHLLASLLSLPAVTVHVLVRGDARERLRARFIRQGLDFSLIDAAFQAKRLHLLQISDLGLDELGCSPLVYQSLLKAINIVIHCAWNVDFNHSVLDFRTDLRITRAIAQFCASCHQPTNLHFITSYSSSIRYDSSALVPEVILEPRVEYSLVQGYAISKLIAEHMLYRIRLNDPSSFTLRIHRVAQVCGDSINGIWTPEELVPMILSATPSLQMVPDFVPDVSWIPADVCANAICEIIVKDYSSELRPPPCSVFHLANPHIVSWSKAVEYFVEVAKLPQPRLVSLATFTHHLETMQSSSKDGALMKIVRILPFFQATLSKGGFPDKHCHLDVTETIKLSPALAACPPIDASYMEKLAGSLLPRSHAVLSNSISREAPNTSRLSLSLKRCVFMFGPWYSSIPHDPDDSLFSSILSEICQHANHVLTRVVSDMQSNDLEATPELHLQLRTLALQLFQVESLKSEGVQPVAVIGYCFGDFAAAITSGRISMRDAVDIITRRAIAIGKYACIEEDGCASTSGAMLNVFAPAQAVRRLLCVLPDAIPDIAIHAGPMHTVLSGSQQAISSARKAVEHDGLRSICITTTPFHSRQMDKAARLLSKLLPERYAEDHSRGGTETEVHGGNFECAFVSSLTTRPISSAHLQSSYWVRHMREPLRFYESMETVRDLYLTREDGNTILVDIGPGVMLRKMVERYGWKDIKLVSASALQEQSEPEIATESNVVLQPNSDLFAEGFMQVQSSNFTPFDPKKHPAVEQRRDSLETAIVSLLSLIFSFEDDSENLLDETFSALGIDSLSYVRLSQEFSAATGMELPPSFYFSNLSIRELLRSIQ